VTPLTEASGGGQVGVVRWLLDKGVAINEQTNPGHTALVCACRFGRTPVVRLLLERGATLLSATF
jgi:ankyrin repeat protein